MTDQPQARADLSGVAPSPSHVRRSDRVQIELAIQVWGTDGQGKSFLEDTHTEIVSRHGAKIRLNRKLVPEQELSVRCMKTGLESDIRVVGQLGGDPEHYHYGLELLNREVNFWGIEFPAVAESESAVARALLECGRCRTQELVCLNEFEAEVFEVNRSLSRRCKKCADISLWKHSMTRPSEPSTAPTAAPSPPAAPVRTENERKDIRVGLRMRACIRTQQVEELVTTENVSRGGLSFKSSNHYNVGNIVEVAIPFLQGAANIFAPARIIHVEYLSREACFLYGLGDVHQLSFD